jgi:hypothetical protein
MFPLDPFALQVHPATQSRFVMQGDVQTLPVMPVVSLTGWPTGRQVAPAGQSESAMQGTPVSYCMWLPHVPERQV